MGPNIPRKLLLTLTLTVCPAAVVYSTPTELTVIPEASHVNVTLCVSPPGFDECDSDGSVVTGRAVVSLDCHHAPLALTLFDYSFELTDSIDLSLLYQGPFGLELGSIDVTATDIRIFMPPPPSALPATPLVNDQYDYPDVPSAREGIIDYDTSGIICDLVEQGGGACTGTADLSTAPPGTETLSGDLTAVARRVTMRVNMDVEAPLDPDNPDLGSLHLFGAVVLEGTIGPVDLQTFVNLLLARQAAEGAFCEADYNFDGRVDGRDIAPYIQDLLDGE